MYYYHGEYIADCNNNFKISDDKLSVTNINSDNKYHTIYFNQWIPSISECVAIWTVEMTKITNESGRGVYFGIVSKDGGVDEDFSNDDDLPNYAFGVTRDSFHSYEGADVNMAHERGEDFVFYTGDIVKVTLNLKDKAFGLELKDKKAILYQPIKVSKDIKYKLAMQLFWKGDFVKLKDFSIN